MMKNDENSLRVLVRDYGLKLQATGLVQGTWGNLSVRLDEDTMLVTPSGLAYDRIRPEDIVKVDIRTLAYEGNLKPTSEKTLHAGIYRIRDDAGAVIHTHSTYCSIFAASLMPLPVEDEELRAELGDVLAVSEHALAGTDELTENTLRALGAGAGCLMAHHGMICVGRNMAEAFDRCQAAEEAAKRYIDSRWDIE